METACKAVLAVIFAASLSSPARPDTNAPPSMVWISGGEFTMGSDDVFAKRNEQPPHRVKVTGFWMDETPVTNAQFERFVKASG